MRRPQPARPQGQTLPMFRPRFRPSEGRAPRSVENAQSTSALPYVFFVSGELPYFGASRFDVAHFNFAGWT